MKDTFYDVKINVRSNDNIPLYRAMVIKLSKVQYQQQTVVQMLKRILPYDTLQK